MNNRFKKPPYPIWICLIVLLFTLTCIIYQVEKKAWTSQSFRQTIEVDFQHRQADLNLIIDPILASGPIDSSLLINRGSHFNLILFDSNQPVWWNTNDISLRAVEGLTDNFANPQGLKTLDYVSYVVEKFFLPDSNRYFLTFIPIARQYDKRYRNFKTGFVANARIPGG